MKLFLIRHGKMAGDPFCTPDPPVEGCLSEEGIAQAEATAEALREIRIDTAFSSPYGRALQTAEIALKGKNVSINIVPEIHEWLPDHELKELPSTNFEDIQQQVSRLYAEETWKTPLGEGTFDIYARVCPAFLKALAGVGIHARHGGYVSEERAKDLQIAVFAHGGSLNVLLSFLLKIPPFPVGVFSFRYTGMATIEFVPCQDVYYPTLLIPAAHSVPS